MITMQIFSTFEHSSYLELAIATLEKRGIHKDYIFAAPLDNRAEERKFFDILHRSDGVSLIDVGMALAIACSAVGASIGFKLDWGPIYWGLSSAFGGFIIGLVIKLIFVKVIKKKQRLLQGKHTEIILIVDCDESQGELVESILWNHFALGVAKVQKG
jgi:hypothetical protein